jgi:hypothetical protein
VSSRADRPEIRAERSEIVAETPAGAWRSLEQVRRARDRDELPGLALESRLFEAAVLPGNVKLECHERACQMTLVRTRCVRELEA